VDVVVDDVSTVVDVDVVAGGCVVVVGVSEVVVATELLVLPPLMRLLLHATSAPPTTMVAISDRQTLIRAVCQRLCCSTDQGVGFFTSFN
jgi:hypothetical protein